MNLRGVQTWGCALTLECGSIVTRNEQFDKCLDIARGLWNHHSTLATSCPSEATDERGGCGEEPHQTDL